MKFLLDSNTLSLLMGGDPAVSEKLLSHARTDVLVPPPVVAEIEYGLARFPRSKQKQRLQKRSKIFLEELPKADWKDDVSRFFG